MTKVRKESNIPCMGQAEEIRDILRVQDQLIHKRAVWDAGPWLELDMSTPQFKALLLISEEEGIRMRELARKMGGSFSNATVLVDRLVERGLVERMAEPEDRRVVLVRVSEEGRFLIEQLVTSWRAISPSVLETLAPKELDTVHDALLILLGAAQRDRRA
ncbi:MAG: MarR family transcriptional regulator [Rubrobacteraceae bacterium]